jgi:hypothetical protein
MKIIVLLICLVFTNFASAKTVARVIEVKGNAFTFSPENPSMSLRYGSKIADLSEVMVEDGSAVSLINNDGHIYHVSGGTLLKFYKGFVDVKSGQVWIVAKDVSAPGAVHSSNSIAKYNAGQFIYSFDNQAGKTQLLVLSGDVSFSNALEPDVAVDVPAGYFSFVEQSFERGLPRAPTKVGLKSYKKFKTLFVNFDSLKDTSIEKSLWGKPVSKNMRSIASVNDQFNMSGSNGKRGKIIKITTYKSTGRVPASVSPMKYYSNIKKKEATRRRPASTSQSVKIKYFGFKWNKKSKPVQDFVPSKKRDTSKPIIKTTKAAKKINNPLSKVSRKAASVSSQKIIRELSGTSVFEKTLLENANSQKRHSEEVNSLIDDLKSYKQDYSKEY